jgi:hypothetical protein
MVESLVAEKTKTSESKKYGFLEAARRIWHNKINHNNSPKTEITSEDNSIKKAYKLLLKHGEVDTVFLGDTRPRRDKNSKILNYRILVLKMGDNKHLTLSTMHKSNEQEENPNIEIKDWVWNGTENTIFFAEGNFIAPRKTMQCQKKDGKMIPGSNVQMSLEALNEFLTGINQAVTEPAIDTKATYRSFSRINLIPLIYNN